MHPNYVTATGWGDVGNGKRIEVLQKVNLELFSQFQCKRAYNNESRRRLGIGIAQTQICYGDTTLSKKDTCSGDSGGPLQIEKSYRHYQIVAITSFGSDTCGLENNKKPGVYTRVSSYISWIRSILNARRKVKH